MDKFIERVAKAPLGTKFGVVLGTLLAVTLINYFVFSLPYGPSVSEQEKRIERLGREQAAVDSEFIEKTSIANNLNQFRREKEVLEQRLNEALAELPEAKDIDTLLQLFQDRAVKSGLEIQSIELQSPVSEGFYAKIPIPMQVTGNFHEIATFFDALGRLRRIVNVSDIRLDSPKDVNGKVLLNGKFLVTTFMFVSKTPGAGSPK